MPTVRIPEAFRHLFVPSRYKATFGGRGSGKSHAKATALVIRGVQQPTRALCAREIQKSIKDSVKRLLDDKIEACGLSRFYTSTDTEIRGPNGTRFVFAGLRTNPDSIKSMEGIDVAWVEEANTVSQRSLDLLIPTIRKPGSEIWFGWNPRHAKDPVDAMFRGGEPPPDALIRRVNWDLNPWFPDVLRAEMEWDRRRDPEKYQHVWEGEYLRNSEARVFRNWRVEPFETPSDATFYFGGDWGFSVDPTVLVRCFIVDRTIYVDREAYAVGCEIDQTPFLFGGGEDPVLNPQRWPGIPGARDWVITADSSRPETISYMRKHGFPRIAKAVKGPGSVEEGIKFLQSYDIVVHPSCRHTADELTLYSYKTDPLTEQVLPVLEDKKNHVIDALRYALETVRRNKPFEWYVGQ